MDQLGMMDIILVERMAARAMPSSDPWLSVPRVECAFLHHRGGARHGLTRTAIQGGYRAEYCCRSKKEYRGVRS